MSQDEGRLVAGRYRLQSRIGSGAMGVVWRGVDERLDRTVAVKQLLLPPGLNEAEGERARQRAFREGRIAARLQHPHAISLYNVAEDDGGAPVLVMEYLPSRSLSDVLDERGVLPPVEVARIGSQVALALVAAHEAGIIHRDVKPGNILLGNDGTTKITDFGISRAAGDITVTSTGLLAGTPAFLSPEAARGTEPGPASDVFSLGATLYAAVEGVPPFGSTENEIALLHTVATGQVIPPRQAGPLTAQLEAMLRTDAAARPTMRQAADGLQAVGEGRLAPPPPPAEPPTMPATAPVPPPRRPATRLDLHPTSNPPGPPPSRPASMATPAAAPNGTRRPRKRIVLAAFAVLAAAAVGVLVAELLVNASEREPKAGGATPTSSAAPSSPRSSAPSETPTPTPEEVSPADLEQAVADYYSQLPDDTDSAWEGLGPGLQAQGMAQYEAFWRDVKKVEIIAGPRARDEDTVRVGLLFVVGGGDKYREVHELGMVSEDGAPLIDSDTVLSSRKSKGDDKDDKKDRDNDEEDGGDG